MSGYACSANPTYGSTTTERRSPARRRRDMAPGMKTNYKDTGFPITLDPRLDPRLLTSRTGVGGQASGIVHVHSFVDRMKG